MNEKVLVADDEKSIVDAIGYHIQRLRKKWGRPYQRILKTVYGVGCKAIGEME